MRWFKLLLLESQDLRGDLRNSKTPLDDSREKLRMHAGSEPAAVVDLIASFLQKLWEQFIGAELRPLGVPTSGVVDPWLGTARLV